MGFDWSQFWPLFADSLSLWWVIVPAIFLGLIVGAIPGFSAQNTLIILLPVTLAMPIDAALAVAERLKTDGPTFLRSVVVGYDICCRITPAIGVGHLGDSFRSTHAIGGVFGAAAASAFFSFCKFVRFNCAADNSCLLHIGGGLSRARVGIGAVHLSARSAPTGGGTSAGDGFREASAWPADDRS